MTNRISGTIAFIGGGNMAGAIIQGLVNTQSAQKEQITIAVNSEQSQQAWQEQGYEHVYVQPDSELSSADIWVLAVKPQVMHDVVQQYRGQLRDNTLVISVAAGINCDSLAQWLGSSQVPYQRLIRAMPNTPSLIGQGVVGIYGAQEVDAQDMARAQALFAPCGKVFQLAHENMIDAITGVSGSGPAYVFLFIESLIEGAQALGFDKQQATEIAMATVSGATALAQQSDQDAAQLRKNVTSKGGTTAAALAVFEEQGFKHIVAQAMQAASKRGSELAKELAKPH
ncbi:pyrroline-5-carboxylate reductase [Brackiella oedipodis]|uniref:pyrroline-5-carboxylate reductase n=1 Tax=Brackiella oedipodis TaxID=124225 RepID=UPI00048FD436|nr:pyrroline-5-carboxylate reductase [Brackiella oedipodis]